MRLFTAVFTIALTAFFLVPVSAQQGMHHSGTGQMMQADSTTGMPGMMGAQGMMGPGMMQGGMMQGGMMPGMMGRGMMQGGMMSGMRGRCMMGGGMMSGMMGQQPMMKYLMLVKMLPNMQESLSLTENQAKKLIDIRADFQKQQIDYKTDLMKKRVDLQNMLKQEATTGQIKKQLQFCSETKINMHVATYETVQKMKSVLNEEQKEMLETMIQQNYGMMN